MARDERRPGRRAAIAARGAAVASGLSLDAAHAAATDANTEATRTAKAAGEAATRARAAAYQMLEEYSNDYHAWAVQIMAKARPRRERRLAELNEKMATATMEEMAERTLLHRQQRGCRIAAQLHLSLGPRGRGRLTRPVPHLLQRREGRRWQRTPLPHRRVLGRIRQMAAGQLTGMP